MVATVGALDARGTPGMPQLDFSTWGNQIFWLVLTLIAIYLILSRVALPRIGAILAERQGTITNDIAAAEDLKLKQLKPKPPMIRRLSMPAQKHTASSQRRKLRCRLIWMMPLQRQTLRLPPNPLSLKRPLQKFEPALESVKEVAKDTAKEIVAAMGGKADASTITAAVTARMKG